MLARSKLSPMTRGGGNAGTIETVCAIPHSEASAARNVDAAVQAHGGLDIVFIATGLKDVGFIEDQPYEKWSAVMRANLDGYWVACQVAGSHFADRPPDRGRAKGVVASSTRGRHGLPAGYTAYCASKSGLDGMVRALACEWGAKGANINAIGPTVFRSPPFRMDVFRRRFRQIGAPAQAGTRVTGAVVGNRRFDRRTCLSVAASVGLRHRSDAAH